MTLLARCLNVVRAILVSHALSIPAMAAENPWFVELGYSLSKIDSPLEITSPGGVVIATPSIWIPAPGGSLNYNPPSGFETDESLAFTLGYRFGSNWGAEVSYLDFGDFGSRSTYNFGGTPYILQQTQVNIDGLNLALFGEIPVSERWAVRGKVGVFAFDSESGFVFPSIAPMRQGISCDVTNDRNSCYNPFFVVNNNSNPITPIRPVNSVVAIYPNSSGGGQRISFSVGGKYRINERYSLNLDYSLFNDLDNSDIQMLKLGLSYSF